MKIGEIAKQVDLPVKTVRYYADIGLVSPAERSEAGYRIFGRSALKQLQFVRHARSFGFTIEECRELLGLYDDQTRSSADVKAIAQKRLVEIEKKQKELEALRVELAHVVEACHGDARPDCPILDHLA